MDISLRKASESDIDFLLQLRDITMRKYLEEVGAPTTEDEFLYRVQYHFEDAKIIEANGRSIGLFKASFLPELNQWYLVQIQVHPEFQNLKIGSRLIRELLAKAKAQGVSVVLYVLKSNPAQNLYKSLGFEQVDETEFEFAMECKA